MRYRYGRRRIVQRIVSQNPLTEAVQSSDGSNTTNALVVDRVYAINGVINSINKQYEIYPDPNTLAVNTTSPTILPSQSPRTEWFSSLMDDLYNNTYKLSFEFNRTTFLNYVSFDLADVPCSWELWQNNDTTGVVLARGVNQTFQNGGWNHYTATFNDTYQFDTNIPLLLVIYKLPTNTQYSFGVRNFLTKLKVQSYNDISNPFILSSGIVTQNPLGFVEQYIPYKNSITALTTSDITDYWKCAPQPVGDAIVYFVVDLGSSYSSINRMYLDPLYTGNSLNLYYSNDKVNWSAVQRDFILKKGVYELPTIYARYIKFEISNLTPEPYDLPFDSIDHTISVFPDYVDNYFSDIEQSIPDINNQQYYALNDNVSSPTYNTQLTSTTIFGNASSQLESPIWGSPNQSVSTSTTTSLPSTITDPTTSYKSVIGVSNIGSVYSDPGLSNFIQRRFYQYGSHDYKNITLSQTWHQAYFTGIKQLNLYSYNQTVQNDYEEINDYFLSSNSIVDNSTTTATLTSGGYTGLVGSVIQTKNLQTISEYESFKIAGLNTDWIPFLTPDQTRIIDPSILNNITGAVGVNPIDFSNYNTSTDVGYGILTVSGSTGTSSVTSAVGGGQNLMTTAMATFAASDGWAPNQNTGTTSGTSSIVLPLVTSDRWNPALGENPYGFNAYGASPSTSSASNTYTFLVHAETAASGILNVELNFYNTITTSGITVTSGFPVAVSGTDISFTYTQPTNTNAVRFKLTPSTGGPYTYSKAGYFLGTYANWVAPLLTTNMRISATARIFLPFTNNGSYRCSIYSGDTELAYKQVNNIPTRTWVDIEVPFTLLGSNANNTFTAKLTQINGNREIYQVALLGLFYNPISYEFSSDGGTTWTTISTGINDPNALINTSAPTKQLKLKMSILKDYSYLSSISIVPNYMQNAYSTKTVINYIGDIKSNELSWRRAPVQKPLFQLRQYLHPYEYDISVLMGIPNPYKLN